MKFRIIKVLFCAIYLLIPLVGFGIVFSFVNPGVFYYDFVNSNVSEALNLKAPSNWHYYLYSLYLRFIFHFTINFSILMLIQIILFSLALAYGAITIMTSLSNKIKNQKYLFLPYLIPSIMLIVTSVWPAVVVNVETFNADIFSAIFFIVYVVQVFKIIDTRGEYFSKWTSIISHGTNIAIMVNLRTQYIAIVGLVFVLTMVIYKKKIVVQIVSLLLIFILCGSWNVYLNIANVQPSPPREVLSQPFQMVGAVYKNNGYMTDSEKQFFNKFGDENWWKENYIPAYSNALRQNGAKMPEGTTVGQFLINTSSVCSKNVNICLKAFYDQSSTFYNWGLGVTDPNFSRFTRSKDLPTVAGSTGMSCQKAGFKNVFFGPVKVYKTQEKYLKTVTKCWKNNNIKYTDIPLKSRISKKKYQNLMLNFYTPFDKTNSSQKSLRINYENFWTQSISFWGNFALPFWVMLICIMGVIITKHWEGLLLLLVPFGYWLTLICFGTVNYLYRLVFPMAIILPFVFVACFCFKRENLSYKNKLKFRKSKKVKTSK
ncbi:MAG: hypothetical protein LBM13_02585 [Candidatus Ancillula sp.]|jgi:hypothetical protein|nr:hypothetical protein [Candidatus Ancillula sp.]